MKAEKKKETKYIDDSDNEKEMQRIFWIDRKLLQTCFVCGKRNPKEDGETDMFWVSCSSNEIWKAWTHTV